MDLRHRLNRIKEKIREKQGNRPVLIVEPDEDVEQKKKEFEKIYGKDHDTIIISYKKQDDITQ